MVIKGGVEPQAQLFKSIINTSLDAIVCADSKGCILLWNPAAETMFGYSQAEAIGQPLTMILREEDRKAHLAGMAHFLKAEKPQSLIGKVTETWGLKKDGTTFRKDMSLSSEKVDGEWLFIAIMRDVTERKQDEKELHEQQEFLSALLDNIGEAVVSCNERGLLVRFNQAAHDLHGLPERPIAPDQWADYYDLYEADGCTPLVKAHIPLFRALQGELVHGAEMMVIPKNGEPRSLVANGQPLRDAKGRVIGAVVSMHDITERKQVEETAQQERDKLESFFSLIPSLVCIAGTDGYFKEVNLEWEKALGYSREELLSIPFTDIIHPDDLEMTLKEVEQQIAGNKTMAFTNRYRHKDGGYRWLEWTAIAAVKGDVLYAAAKDVTDHRQLSEALQQRLEESEKLRQATLFMLEDLNASGAAIKQAKEAWEETFDAVTDPIFLHDSELRILRANRAYAERAGVEIGDVVGKLYWEVFPKGDGPLPGCLKALEKAAEEEVSTEDGSIYLSRSYVIPAEDGSYHASIHVMHDITESRQAEINLVHVNRALATLSIVNHELVHAENEPDLMQAICRVIVEQQGYHMAWVGYVQHDEEHSIKIMASAGAGQELLDTIRPGWGKNELGMGPCGRAVRTGKIHVVQDIAADPNYQQWGDVLLKSGCAADIALPILDADKQVFGLLHVYAERVNAFTDKEISLLQEMADDLAFGVRSLRLRQHRDEIMAVNEKQLVQIHRNLQETIAAVASAVGARDPYTAGHQLRVAKLATAIACAMGLDEGQIEGIRMGATIHDIGKIQLPAEILSKPSALSEIEYSLIKGHPEAGYNILRDIHFPWPVADIAHQHHERLDGSGYPQGLKGDEICIEARIVAVADVVEAMSSHRPYRAELGIDAALDEVREHRGSWYDEDVVDACLKLFKEKKFSFESEEASSTA